MVRTAACLGLLLFSVGLARAEDDSRTAEAREHYARAQTHYDLRDFERAIAEYQKSYELSHAPELLFNIAQACRLLKDPEQALYYYRTYLRLAPEAVNRGDVEGWIAEMEEAVRARPQAPPPVPVEAREARVPAARPGGGLRVAGLSVSAAGAAAFVAGLALAASARSASNAVSRVSNSGGAWSGDLEAVWRRGERDGRWSVGLLTGGGAALGVGVVLYHLGSRAPAQVAASPVAGGGWRAQVAWRF